MSRIGNKEIQLPKGVTISFGDRITVKGPKGELSEANNKYVEVVEKDGVVKVTRNSDAKPARAAHGLIRALVANMVQGVDKGFERKLEINGVGYRAEVSGQKMVLNLGFSHPINYPLPDGIKAKVEKNVLTLTGIDKQLLGSAAAKIRSFRPPEPYKGKGVKYMEERIIRKVGKAAG